MVTDTTWAALPLTPHLNGYKYTYTIELDTRSPLDVKTEVIDWLDRPSVTVTVEKEFEVYRPVGEGTPENPYTLEDARNIAR